MEQLLHKIENKRAKVCVIGLGYVGLPLAITFAKQGFKVHGVDINSDKIRSLNNGISYIDDVSSDFLKNVLSSFDFSVSTNYGEVANADVVIVCVPTPLDHLENPDLSYLFNAIEGIAKYIHKDMLVSLESTIYPGVTREQIAPMLKTSELLIGRDIFLCFSPERINPGCKRWSASNTPKIVGGVTKECLSLGSVLYSKITNKIVTVSSTDSAEMVKILENSFRAVNIAFINEMMIVCDKLNVDIWEVIEAAGTKPFGFMKFYPGPGVGGHCIPIDPSYLNWKLKMFDYESKFISLAVQVNSSMPAYWVNKIEDALREQHKKLRKSKILVMGVAYKADISDFRESPALEIIRILVEEGAEVNYHDPYIPSLEIDQGCYFSVQNLTHMIEESDCVIIVTNHSCYKEIDFADLSKITINSRGEKLVSKQPAFY